MKILFFTVFVFLSSLSYGFKTDSLQQTKSKPIELNNQKSDTNNNNLYKLLYENTKENNSELLSLLSTSLAVIIAVIIAIIGSSFFYNYRFNRKEYELLNKETQNQIEETQAQLLNDTRKEIKELSEKYKKDIDDKFIQLNDTYKTNFDTIRESFKDIITSFKQDLDKQVEKLSENVETIESQINDIKEATKKDITYNEKNLMREILDIKGEIYFLKEWYGPALSTFVDQGILAVEVHHSWQLEYILDDIIRCINKIIEKKDTITTLNKQALEKLIGLIPEYLNDKKETIINTYENIEIKEIEYTSRRGGLGLLGSLLRGGIK